MKKKLAAGRAEKGGGRFWAGLALGIWAIWLGAGATAWADQENTETEPALTGLIFQSMLDGAGPWTGAGAEKLYEDTGLRLEFYSNGSGHSQTLLQYMAAGTLPDLIGVESSQVKLLLDAGLLQNLDEYKEELGAVFEDEAYRAALAYCRDAYGGEEGALCLLPMEVGKAADKDLRWLPMLQWKPYAQAGCPGIGTLEDYLDVVETMLRYKPATVLGEPVYGFSLYRDPDDDAAAWAASLSYLYGTDTGLVSQLMELDARTGELSPVTEEDSFYKRALSFYFQANQRGLLDPESRNQTYENFQEKYRQGRVLFANDTGLVQSFNQEEDAKGYGFNAYAPVFAGDMAIYRESGSPVGDGWYFGVNASGRNKTETAVLLNWLYTAENIRYLYDRPEDLSPFESLGLSRAAAGAREQPVRIREADPEGETAWGYQESVPAADWLAEEGRIVQGSSAVNLLPEISASVRSQCSRIGEAISQYSWEMIYAESEEEFEELWKEMAQKSRELGIDVVADYYASAWEQALERETVYGEGQ